MIVTIAIYLHNHGLPARGTIGDPAPPLIDEDMPSNEAGVFDGETIARDETARPGEQVPFRIEISAEDKTASSDETAAPPSKSAERRGVAPAQPTLQHHEDVTRVNALRNQSTSAFNLGNRDEALTAITEATDLVRALAADHPATFNAELAASLRILSSRLVDVGRNEDALVAIEEAVYLHRDLAKECRAESNAELASSLNHLANRLSRLDRLEESLLAIQESVDLYRTLAQERPELHKPGLAASLFNLSSRFAKYDLQEEALVAIQEAADIYRDLATKHPESYRDKFASSLNKLTACEEGLCVSRKKETVSAGHETTNSADLQEPPSTHPTKSGTGTAGPIAPRHGGVAPSGPAFYTTGSGIVNNVAGDYITGDEEPVTKIARILPYVDGASWDPKLTCLPNTRETILRIISSWANATDLGRVFWLKGLVGSGKSAIAHTIAQALAKRGLLGSSFFFNRDIPSRNTAKMIISTIARDLANAHPAIKCDIARLLEDEPALATAALTRQFQELILGPLTRHPIQRPFVVVIDALDESIDNENLDNTLLSILGDEAHKLPPHFRIFVTSRPIRHIEDSLSGKDHVVSHSIDIRSAENLRDVAAYIDFQLQDKSITEANGPDEAQIRELKRLAEGLFIWIATIFNYLRTAYNPRAKLNALLSGSMQKGLPPEKKMDGLYASILQASGDWTDEDFVRDYDIVIGTIMAAKRPLSLAAIQALHSENQSLTPKLLLERFGSVLTGFDHTQEPIRILHLSFREFITVRANKAATTQHFYVSEKAHSSRLASLCLKTINRDLAISTPGTGYLSKEQDDIRGIPDISGVSEQLLYCCEFCSDHVMDVENPISVRDDIRQMVSHHLMTCMEIVTSASVFRGSLMLRRWWKIHFPELEKEFDMQSQASALFCLSDRLSNQAGRYDEAYVAGQEATDLYKELASANPAAFSSNFIMSLRALTNRFARLGRWEEGLEAIQQAVYLSRGLAADDPAEYTWRLAACLKTLSDRLSYGIGSKEDALKAGQEAVDLYRALAAERPMEFRWGLAMSLYNLSLRLSEFEERDTEALEAIEEAVSLCRALADRRPVFNEDLAWTLNALSSHLTERGRWEEALADIQEAVKIRRVLAEEKPATRNELLAMSLVNLCVCLSDAGRQEEALAAMREAAERFQALGVENPGMFDEDFSQSLSDLCRCLSGPSLEEDVLVNLQRSIDMYLALTSKRRGLFNVDLVRSLKNLSVRLPQLSRKKKAGERR
ncbi:hypothetical protein HWV62_18440 [Athelia sp. TMB]|nr:hypothetical protein HWV62_18440 [Athelia sp. TMB]